MKKFLCLFLGMILAVALSACSFGPKNASEVLEKAEKASKDIQSFKENSVSEMKTTEQGQSVVLRTEGSSEIQKKPLAAYINQTVESGRSVNIKMYMTKDSIYLKSPEEPDMWLKMNHSDNQQLAGSNPQSLDIQGLLKSLKSQSKHFDLIEKDHVYVLKFNGNGQDFAEFLNKMTRDQMAGIGNQSKAALENAEYHHVSLTYSFDKEKFTPKAMNLKLDMTIADPEHSMEKTDLNMNLKVNYSQINKVKVSVPESVKNNAREWPSPNQNQENDNSYKKSI
ncbi:hypothetical protein JOD45_000184 [Scopulibacillus daqui]|uniref:DUF4292 domain-containing protein n=1 Tax=Scopulibacillus daqui TaxID=1469162 RepID=A0ABS2PVB2_9BACL|nr:DUF6612 family protein [Scopulibacillus daqui]MBM7643993.1 hypothetical protein [Scopulibacillus daqui]